MWYTQFLTPVFLGSRGQDQGQVGEKPLMSSEKCLQASTQKTNMLSFNSVKKNNVTVTIHTVHDVKSPWQYLNQQTESKRERYLKKKLIKNP